MAIIPPLSRKARILLMGSLMAVLVIVGLTLGIVIPLVYSKDKDVAKQSSGSTLGIYKNAAVVTDAAPCAVVGKDILLRNGSAVDSAIATLLCMGVAVPQSMGLGGGFFMVIYDKESGEVKILDSRETAPSNANQDMFGGDPQASAYGGKSVAIPGELHGYREAHDAYGKLPWSELFAGAINVSRDGYPVVPHLANAIQGQLSHFAKYPALKDLLFNKDTNQTYKENEILKEPTLSATLEELAKDPNYWDNVIAKILVEDIVEDGGIMTLNDIINYKPVWKNATESQIGSKYTLYSVPLPGSGPILSFMLNVLQNYNFTAKSPKVLTHHRIIETFKFAYSRRMELGDFGDNKVQEDLSVLPNIEIHPGILLMKPELVGDKGRASLVKQLMSMDFAKSTKEKIFDNQTHEDPAYYGVQMYLDEDHGTAHLSVLAPNGDAVTVTSTINAYFGSKLRSARTGIILNNEMDDFSSPNITNGFNVPPSIPNYIEPGKKPLSSMCPSLIIDKTNGNVKMAIGGAGGTHITTGVALVILKNLYMEENIKEAIDAPRIHHQLFPDNVTYEKEFDQGILKSLETFGHKTKELTGRGAVIQAISRGDDNRLYANSDYRKGGDVSGF